ncbi:Phosphoethanolamine transferase EptA [Pigmentiphaga humi]|uniref:Phosphoethanolamine transferase EptA n=1 Tax=Pigmentiphaga humi TaxID=2478468 RepID=A0A3P4B0G8_9BURK|nr:phosphoethanolamine--lipid A transferase [Pigmentiphaga humi]VCU69803.1 Phosphoethanolamine transferase EptA [Pigmentiphaga humi]
MFRSRPLAPEALAFLAGLLFLAFYNIPLWRRLGAIAPAGDQGGLAMQFAFAAMVLSIFTMVLVLASFRWVFKPALVVLCMASSVAAYFMLQYGVLIDKGMLRNVAETDVREVRGLLSPRLLLMVLGLGVLPSWLIIRVPVAYRPLRRELLGKAAAMLAALGVLALVALGNYQGLAALLRNHHELRMMVVPSNYLAALVGFAKEEMAGPARPIEALGQDARRAAAWAGHKRRSLTVLVVGESARAENFGVLGYARDTTPRLAAEPGLIAYGNVSSCGTETAVSLPCMFSNMPRRDYDANRARRQEGLLDVIQRAGLRVTWRDNQSGCKGTCSRVAFENVREAALPAYCAEGECHDEVLLHGLQDYIDTLQGDAVLVLHQMGSHGPDYYRRYPRAAARFGPVCASNALNTCSRDSIVNAYDNTIAYTDHVLGALIDRLRANQDKLDVAMLYVSDHGESLGEYRLYLHGTPYMLAPSQQTHVAMLAWFSPSYAQDFGLDLQCVRRSRQQAYSHDNYFHSVLGLLQIQTSAYEPELDMFAPCRRKAIAGPGDA